MLIKVLGIGGSPRKGGNSDSLLDMALKGAREEGAEIEKIILNELAIKPCQECGGCYETGACIIDDDMQIIYDKLAQVHGLIVASPIFFSGISAQLKAMIDRIQCHWIAKYRLVKEITNLPEPREGVFISVRGQRGHAVFKAAAKPVKAFMATEGFHYLDELFCEAVDYKGAVQNQPEALTKACELGQKLVKSIKGGAENG
jgi:multimeric flavodoxin WrbA